MKKFFILFSFLMLILCASNILAFNYPEVLNVPVKCIKNNVTVFSTNIYEKKVLSFIELSADYQDSSTVNISVYVNNSYACGYYASWGGGIIPKRIFINCKTVLYPSSNLKISVIPSNDFYNCIPIFYFSEEIFNNITFNCSEIPTNNCSENFSTSENSFFKNIDLLNLIGIILSVILLILSFTYKNVFFGVGSFIISLLLALNFVTTSFFGFIVMIILTLISAISIINGWL